MRKSVGADVLSLITNIVADFDLCLKIQKAYVLSSKEHGFAVEIKTSGGRKVSEGWAFGYPNESGARANRIKEKVLLEALKEAFDEMSPDVLATVPERRSR